MEDGREEIFAEYLVRKNSDVVVKIVCNATHKLVFTASGIHELFDLVADPGKLKNRINAPLSRAVLSDLP